jgi:HD-GYP domain-containing protein (c-di-GMP phosphodiesterase class II)
MAVFNGEESSTRTDVQKLLEKVVADIRFYTARQVSQMNELVKIGVALSAEKNLASLLEMIVNQARRITNADGATLYIKNEAENILEFAIVSNKTLGIRMGGSGSGISWPPVPLALEDGTENHRNVSAHCALVGKVVNIPDVYQAEGFDFEGTREFDRRTGYRSKSMLLIPMRNHEDEVIGVLQLLNTLDSLSGEVTEFPVYLIDIVTSLASQAAIGITKMRLAGDLESLFACFIKAIADAIDEKSPYTAGHILRVAELTERLASEVDRSEAGPLADIHFSDDDLAELRMAAWMHDVGKITTPEYIIDKSTKLETIFDRIELIRCRVELLKKEAEIADLKARLGNDSYVPSPAVQELDAQLRFLEKVNGGRDFLTDEEIERVRSLANLKVPINGRKVPLLDSEEVRHLLIRQGTITGEEREIVENHVAMGQKILESLPFPKKMRRVPLFAGMHHERSDGSGYPQGLAGEEIPMQAKILAVADIFEALTAIDRPYKHGKQLSEAMQTLETLADNGQLDSSLCDLMVESGIVTEYAATVLTDRQLDDFAWRGRSYRVRRQGPTLIRRPGGSKIPDFPWGREWATE